MVIVQGQAIVKINMGDVLDSEGNWLAALKTFEEGYRYDGCSLFETINANMAYNLL